VDEPGVSCGTQIGLAGLEVLAGELGVSTGPDVRHVLERVLGVERQATRHRVLAGLPPVVLVAGVGPVLGLGGTAGLLGGLGTFGTLELDQVAGDQAGWVTERGTGVGGPGDPVELGTDRNPFGSASKSLMARLCRTRP
jgi:hypothetical protein